MLLCLQRNPLPKVDKYSWSIQQKKSINIQKFKIDFLTSYFLLPSFQKKITLYYEIQPKIEYMYCEKKIASTCIEQRKGWVIFPAVVKKFEQ